jgi:hypothetical protein
VFITTVAPFFFVLNLLKFRYTFNFLKMKKNNSLIVILAVVVLLIFVSWIFTRGEPLGQDFSKAMADQGATHIDEGTDVEYKTNPPTSGNHWPEALLDGLYDTEKPDEAIVHSLEHGRVWISYNPKVSGEVVARLNEILKRESAVILTPRSGNDTDIALSAWTRLDTFNLEDGNLTEGLEKRISDFIQRYKHKGPELIKGIAPGKSYE